jgi:hypothetical protein
LTAPQSHVIRAVHEFWRTHANAPPAWRNQLVEQFLADLTEKGVNLTAPIMRHPKTYRKSFRRYSVLDIMADFLLDVDQVAERSQDYPVWNAEKALREERRQQKSELSIIFDEELDDNYDEYTRPPSYSILEHAFNKRNPIEELFFAEPRADTVEELTQLITEVKANEDYYVNKYADPNKPWNQTITDKKRTAKNVRKAIRSLDVTRVRECRVCGGAFYAHDRRRWICDVQPYPRVKRLSCCEYKNLRNQQEIRKIDKHNSIKKCEG